MDGRGRPQRGDPTGTPRILRIYAMPDCPGWGRALMLAALIAESGLHGVDVQIVDLANATEPLPHAVIASPTWMLDGRRIALGNPDPDWLLALLGGLPAGEGD